MSGFTGEVNGVRLDDVFRDTHGKLWEVVGLCTEPTVTVRNCAGAA